MDVIKIFHTKFRSTEFSVDANPDITSLQLPRIFNNLLKTYEPIVSLIIQHLLKSPLIDKIANIAEDDVARKIRELNVVNEFIRYVRKTIANAEPNVRYVFWMLAGKLWVDILAEYYESRHYPYETMCDLVMYYNIFGLLVEIRYDNKSNKKKFESFDVFYENLLDESRSEVMEAKISEFPVHIQHEFKPHQLAEEVLDDFCPGEIIIKYISQTKPIVVEYTLQREKPNEDIEVFSDDSLATVIAYGHYICYI